MKGTIKIPSKSEEIQILTNAAKKLGPNSYCGQWLLEQIPVIEHTIRSDMAVDVSFARCQRECEAKLSLAREEAERLRSQAKEEAKKIVTEARDDAHRVKTYLLAQLHRTISTLQV